jgi:ABC-type phosphate transport system substrate-binding protein
MKNLTTRIVLITALCIASAYSIHAQEVCVIVNAENPSATLTASQVKLAYLRKINKRWKELNKNIVPVDRKSDTDTRKKFLKDVLQMSADEVSRYFTEREYQNAEAPPVKLASDDEVVSFVESNIGAIGYVLKSAIKPDSKVKIVLTL